MARRDARVRSLIERAAEACRGVTAEAAEEVDSLKLGEVLHAQLGGKPNEVFVLAKFTNTRQPPVVLRCHVCEELLSQLSVASWPVRLQRTDGTWFHAVLMTCDDPSCAQRLMEKLSTEGP